MLALLILHFNRKLEAVRLGTQVWGLLILGAIVCVVAFCWDYSTFIVERNPAASIFSIPFNSDLWDLAFEYVPRGFPWWMYWLGVAVICGGIGLFYRKQQQRLAMG